MQSSKELPIEEQLSQVTADMSVSGDSCLEVYTVGSTAPFSLDELSSGPPYVTAVMSSSGDSGSTSRGSSQGNPQHASASDATDFERPLLFSSRYEIVSEWDSELQMTYKPSRVSDDGGTQSSRKAQLKQTYMPICHYSNGVSLLSLYPGGQSPQLKSQYNQKYSPDLMISLTECACSEPTSPGAIVCNVMSKCKACLMLDHSDRHCPKLVTNFITESKKGLNPVVNVRTYPHSDKFNNTAFYFKTEKDYYFVCVEADGVHLGVKKVSAGTCVVWVSLTHTTQVPVDDPWEGDGYAWKRICKL